MVRGLLRAPRRQSLAGEGKEGRKEGEERARVGTRLAKLYRPSPVPADIYESIHAFFFILFFLEQNLSLSRPAYLRFLENLHDARCVDARFRPLENVGREVDAITQFNREKWPPRPAFRGLTVSIMRVAGSHLGDKAKISTRRLDPIPIKRYVVGQLSRFARERTIVPRYYGIYFAGNNVGEEIVYIRRKGRFLESLEFMYLVSDRAIINVTFHLFYLFVFFLFFGEYSRLRNIRDRKRELLHRDGT